MIRVTKKSELDEAIFNNDFKNTVDLIEKNMKHYFKSVEISEQNLHPHIVLTEKTGATYYLFKDQWLIDRGNYFEVMDNKEFEKYWVKVN